MPIRFEDDAAYLEEVVSVEEAEELLEWVQDHPGKPLDWSGCDHLHTAVLQVLLALEPPLKGTPRDPFLAAWVAPRLAGPAEEGAAPNAHE
ncbi:MAG TPA: hypothetical protein VJ985_05905 [Gammaproteobacteria bacterium]|nr:hypothetical protein [Gammaproteobacteria bacterium]